jgi:hypothetical protein
MRRDVQLSLIDGMDRPVGPVPQSVQTGTNADLIRAVAGLYLTGSVLDVTYGRGRWWDGWRPPARDLAHLFRFHDLALDGVDFRHLPYPSSSWDAVCFDPPYVESGSRSTSSHPRFLDAYGIGTEAIDQISPGGTLDLMLEGTAEVCRVARGFVLVKCMEYVSWHRFHDAPTAVIGAAAAVGWELHDRIVHNSGGGMGGGYRIRDIKRTQRAHSYLLVFAPAPARKP